MPVIKSAIVVMRDDNDGLIRVTNLNNYHPASSKRIQIQNRNKYTTEIHYIIYHLNIINDLLLYNSYIAPICFSMPIWS